MVTSPPPPTPQPPHQLVYLVDMLTLTQHDRLPVLLPWTPVADTATVPCLATVILRPRRDQRRFKCGLKHREPCFAFFPLLSEFPRKTRWSASSDSVQLLRRLRIGSSRLAWSTEFFRGQPVLYGSTMSQKRNRKRPEEEAQQALASFLVRPWVPSLVLAQGAVSRAPPSSCFILQQGTRADRAQQGLLSVALCFLGVSRAQHVLTPRKLRVCKFGAAGGADSVGQAPAVPEDQSLISQNS